jgi:hypothetical protein
VVIDSLPALARRALSALTSLAAAAAATSPLSAQCPLAWASEAPINGAVYTLLAEPDGSLVAGGSMTSIGGVPCDGLARRSPAGVWSAVDPGPLIEVGALACAANGDLLAAGRMTTLNGNRAALVRCQAGGTTVIAIADSNSWILDLAVLSDGSIAVCGAGFLAGVQLRTVARFDGVAWTSMGLQMGQATYSMTQLPNGDLLAGGLRDPNSLTVPSSVARWNGTTWQFLGNAATQDVPFNVYDIAVLADGSPVIIGEYYMQDVARFDGVAWQRLTGGESPTWPEALVPLPDGDLLVSGQTPGTTAANRVARWNGTTWTGLASGTQSGTFPNTKLVRTTDGTVYLGSSLFGSSSQSATLERLETPCAATATRFGAGCASSGGLVELDNVALPWLGASCQNRAVGLPMNALAVLGFGFQTAVTPLSALLPAAAPGCFVWQSLDGLELALSSGGVLDFAFPVPNHAALIGLAVHLQVASLELQGSTILDSAASNRLTLTIGDF